MCQQTVGPKALTISELLEVIGSLVSALRVYAAKLPAVVSLSSLPGGLKPAPEAVTAYEQTVYRCRSQGTAASFRGLIDLLIESLEAFEGGRLLGATQPLLMVLDRLEAMQRDKELAMMPADEQRIQEYRMSLNRILPGNQPELEGAGKGL
ncbi:MAG TPA: hypothetical protein VGQ60_03120 [Nitrospiraceae bacterium]|jgi:hypothetical protein|nr:hypothetical protein [Nitrospiraceae bacterium]